MCVTLSTLPIRRRMMRVPLRPWQRRVRTTMMPKKLTATKLSSMKTSRRKRLLSKQAPPSSPPSTLPSSSLKKVPTRHRHYMPGPWPRYWPAPASTSTPRIGRCYVVSNCVSARPSTPMMMGPLSSRSRSSMTFSWTSKTIATRRRRALCQRSNVRKMKMITRKRRRRSRNMSCPRRRSTTSLRRRTLDRALAALSHRQSKVVQREKIGGHRIV
mmetsp:Transcript_29776/g.71942  ORF Transcript_29776/g.71942 Transcript_29776/m.71942 type:complete len:214 (+) Transcript_29776:809-1450(+)